jgi:ABC-type Zn uptake system ZnuABC Zn-binding protein ZnuA
MVLSAQMRLIRISGAALAAAAALGGCGSDESPRGDGMRVVATTPLVADIARQVAGEPDAVSAMLSPNSDPHEYEPRPSDARSVAEAAVVLRSGGELDEWLADLVDAAGGDAAVVSLIDAVETIEGEDGADPHWWHDPRNGVAAARAVRDALASANPDGRARYARNAARYERELRSVDDAIAGCMRGVPRARRKLVTTHDALGYFARRFGIEVIGSVIPSLSTEAQPSAGDTAKLIEQIEREGVEVIFAESSVDSKVEEAIAREAGARIGDQLWADGLGPDGSSGDTYLGSLQSNADAMARGFTGGEGGCPR